MVTSLDIACGQPPSLTTALYFVVVSKSVYSWVLEVLEMLITSLQLFVVFSHLNTLPFSPNRLKLPEFDPEQTSAFESTVPPIELQGGGAAQLLKSIPVGGGGVFPQPVPLLLEQHFK